MNITPEKLRKMALGILADHEVNDTTGKCSCDRESCRARRIATETITAVESGQLGVWHFPQESKELQMRGDRTSNGRSAKPRDRLGQIKPPNWLRS